MIYGLKPGARAILPGPLYHSAPNSFGLRGSTSLGGVKDVSGQLADAGTGELSRPA